MHKRWLVGGLTLALGACDYVDFSVGGNDSNSAAANAAAGAGNAQASTTPADAGVTTSRSLAGLGVGNAGAGGKDPADGATPAGAATVDPQQLVGRWTDDGNCKRDIEFRPDGTFRSFTGGEGRWEVSGDVLTLSGVNGNFELRLQSLDPDTMTTVNPQGQLGRSTRC
jgi:hypothetical protein